MTEHVRGATPRHSRECVNPERWHPNPAYRNQTPVAILGARASRPQARTGDPPPEVRHMAKRAGRPRSQGSDITEPNAGQRTNHHRFVEDFTDKELLRPCGVRREHRRRPAGRPRLPRRRTGPGETPPSRIRNPTGGRRRHPPSSFPGFPGICVPGGPSERDTQCGCAGGMRWGDALGGCAGDPCTGIAISLTPLRPGPSARGLDERRSNP